MIHPTAKASREPIAAAFSSQYDKRGWGTEGSNPSLSRLESIANLTAREEQIELNRGGYDRPDGGAVFYGDRRHRQPRFAPGPDGRGTEGSNPSPSSGESRANLKTTSHIPVAAWLDHHQAFCASGTAPPEGDRDGRAAMKFVTS
jgi:hypothetical protein